LQEDQRAEKTAEMVAKKGDKRKAASDSNPGGEALESRLVKRHPISNDPLFRKDNLQLVPQQLDDSGQFPTA
jgi:hypothetical protein